MKDKPPGLEFMVGFAANAYAKKRKAAYKRRALLAAILAPSPFRSIGNVTGSARDTVLLEFNDVEAEKPPEATCAVFVDRLDEKLKRHVTQGAIVTLLKQLSILLSAITAICN